MHGETVKLICLPMLNVHVPNVNFALRKTSLWAVHRLYDTGCWNDL